MNRTPTFTKDEKATIEHAAAQCWQEIGGDVLGAREECGMRGDMPRAHVLEVVLDADYLSRHLKDSELYSRFRSLPYVKQKNIIRPAFPYTKYGF